MYVKSMAEIQAPFVRKFFAQNTHYTEFIPETSSSWMAHQLAGTRAWVVLKNAAAVKVLESEGALSR
jgi:hypothetical protein